MLFFNILWDAFLKLKRSIYTPNRENFKVTERSKFIIKQCRLYDQVQPWQLTEIVLLLMNSYAVQFRIKILKSLHIWKHSACFSQFSQRIWISSPPWICLLLKPVSQACTHILHEVNKQKKHESSFSQMDIHRIKHKSTKKTSSCPNYWNTNLSLVCWGTRT